MVLELSDGTPVDVLRWNMTQCACAADWRLTSMEQLSVDDRIHQWAIWFAAAVRTICDRFGVPVDQCMARIAEFQNSLVDHIRMHKCLASELRGGDVGLDAVRKDVHITLERPSPDAQLVMSVSFMHLDDPGKASALSPVTFDLPADSACPVGLVIPLEPPSGLQ